MRIVVAGFCVCLHILLSTTGIAQTVGKFEGKLVLVPLDDGKRMRIVERLTFVDPEGNKWSTDPDQVFDGATIPRALWSIVGSPFTGKYLRAAALHDKYCDKKNVVWKKVHRMFFDAMLAGGVGRKQADLMYFAVYRFGPRWVVDQRFYCDPSPWVACYGAEWMRVDEAVATVDYSQDDFEKGRELIEKKELTPEEIADVAEQQYFRNGNVLRIRAKYGPERLRSRRTIDETEVIQSMGPKQDVSGFPYFFKADYRPVRDDRVRGK